MLAEALVLGGGDDFVVKLHGVVGLHLFGLLDGGLGGLTGHLGGGVGIQRDGVAVLVVGVGPVVAVVVGLCSSLALGDAGAAGLGGTAAQRATAEGRQDRKNVGQGKRGCVLDGLGGGHRQQKKKRREK